MNLSEEIIEKNHKIAVVGLGYVGLPLAIAFSKITNVIGFDINKEKISFYRQGIDLTGEVAERDLRSTAIEFSCDEKILGDAKFFVVTVPTPVKQDKCPDLSLIIQATNLIGRYLSENSIVVYESTVYPGVTEEVCIPLLEKESRLLCGKDFKVGYSPERINPGDKINRLENIKKIVSGIDREAVEQIAKVYETIIQAGTYRVSSIKVAEAVKVAENSQRDINIAFMNELAMVFDRMDISTHEVIEAMNTKWNALNFRPGLVGGHCIGVDPYYFIYKAEKLGYHSQIILSGRKINDSIGRFIADVAIKKLVFTGKVVKEAKLFIFGLAFKENCMDIRNSKVVDMINRFREYGIEPLVVDPCIHTADAYNMYNIELTDIQDVREADCVIFAVAHKAFQKLSKIQIDKMFKNMENSQKIIMDIKSILQENIYKKEGYSYWDL